MDTVWTHVPRITPSSVGDLECGRKYHILRVLKQWPSRPPLENVAFGTAVHDVLRQLYLTRQGGILNTTNIEAMARSAVYRARYPRDVDRQRALGRMAEAIQFYARQHQALTRNSFDEVTDFLAWKLRNDRSFRLKGRTASSVVKLSNEWHLQMQRAKLGHHIQWRGLGIADWTFEDKSEFWR